MLAFIGSLLIFIIGMSILSGIGIGSFIGDRNVDVSIPGEGAFSSIFCSWEPNLGFYLYIVATIVLLANIIFNKSKNIPKGVR